MKPTAAAIPILLALSACASAPPPKVIHHGAATFTGTDNSTGAATSISTAIAKIGKPLPMYKFATIDSLLDFIQVDDSIELVLGRIGSTDTGDEGHCRLVPLSDGGPQWDLETPPTSCLGAEGLADARPNLILHATTGGTPDLYSLRNYQLLGPHRQWSEIMPNTPDNLLSCGFSRWSNGRVLEMLGVFSGVNGPRRPVWRLLGADKAAFEGPVPTLPKTLREQLGKACRTYGLANRCCLASQTAAPIMSV